MHAAAIVMPMPQDGSGFGRALETVLRERPCRVIVEVRAAAATARRRPGRGVALAGRKIGGTYSAWRCIPGAYGLADRSLGGERSDGATG